MLFLTISISYVHMLQNVYNKPILFLVHYTRDFNCNRNWHCASWIKLSCYSIYRFSLLSSSIDGWWNLFICAVMWSCHLHKLGSLSKGCQETRFIRHGTLKAHSHEDKISSETSNGEFAQCQTRRRFIRTTMSTVRNVYESWRCFQLPTNQSLRCI